MGSRAERWRSALSFGAPELEREFRNSTASRDVTFFRLSAASGVVLWVFVGVLFPRVGGSHPDLIGRLALFVGLPISAYGLLLPSAIIRARLQTLGVVNNSTSGLVALAVLYISGLHQYIGAGVVILVLYAFTFIRLPFRAAAIASATYLTVVGALLAVADPRAPEARLLDAAIIYMASAQIAYVAFQLEAAARNIFMQRRIIAEQKLRIQEERDASERLLLNVLPAPIATRLKQTGHEVIAESFEDVSVLFADLVGFTSLCSRLPAPELLALLDELFSAFDKVADRHGVEKIKTIGDSYMAACGVPVPSHGNHTANVVAMALEMIDVVDAVARRTALPVTIRVGVHCGPVVGGVIGKKRFIYDLWGHTVNTASRMESYGVPSAVHMTFDAWERVEGHFEGVQRGVIDVKGIGKIRTVLVNPRSKSAQS